MWNSDWIDVSLLLDILQAEQGHGSGDDIVIDGFKVEAATKKGDNYASEMYRAIVEYQRNGKRLKSIRILKVIPSGEIQRMIMEKNNIFPREIAVYRDVLSKVNGLLQSIGDPTLISPKCTITLEEPKTMLVFEDIKENGFQMADRKIGLDLDHSKLVITKLAKLHACSAVIYRNDASSMNPVLEGAICSNPKRQDFLIFYKMCARQVAQLVESWNDPLFNKLLPRLQNLQNTIISKGIEVYTRDESAFNVLNHDDVWINNMMFRYENASVKDVLLFDYQLAYYGSPGVDLNYFLFGSIREEVRVKHWMELIRDYHNILKETLNKLRYSENVPSIQDVHVEIIRKGFHSVNAVFCLLPIAMMERTENAEMDVFLQENEAGEAFRRDIFANPRLEPLLKRALIHFDHMGYFD